VRSTVRTTSASAALNVHAPHRDGLDLTQPGLMGIATRTDPAA
jgi:hypothetical protein